MSADTRWVADLARNANGVPFPNHSNVVYVLQHDPMYAVGRIWYDEFLDRVFLENSPRRHWRDDDDTRVAVEMQATYGIRAVSKTTVAAAVQYVARQRSRHCVRDWLNSLMWDGTPRIDHAFADYWGTDDTDYTRAASRNFFIGMAARILFPGCKLDTMPVFEGAQGIRKSSALACLGGDWFATSHHAAGGVEFLKVLRGKWLVEIAELQSFTKADVTAAKNMLSTACDTYRPSYGQHTVDYPRQCVFAGTTNSTEWGDDETGLRRFWPVRCGDINLSLLEEAREQLFAEAVASCRDGASWWQMPSQTAEIQAERQFHHEWSSVILDWCDRQPTEGGVMVKDILLGPLAFTIDRLMDKRAQMAVAKILTVAGWKRIPTRISSKRTTKVWYKVDN